MFYKSMFYKSTFYKSTFYKSMFYKSMFYKSTFYKSTFYKSMFYKSTFYKSTPCFTNPLHSTPLHVLQYAVFHWLWLCGQSLFFSRLAASQLDALSRARLTEERKRDCSQSIFFRTNGFIFPLPAFQTCSMPRQDLNVPYLLPSCVKYCLNSQNYPPF